MLQIRPTEISAVADLLMAEHNDVDTLARSVIELIDQLRAKRELYVLVEIHPSLRIVKAVGPYATENQALKDVKLLTRYDTQSQAYLAKMKDPSNIDLG